MSMYNGLELRVPFVIIDWLNIYGIFLWEVKALHGREKGLLRYVVKDLLPRRNCRKKRVHTLKNTYPTYLKAVKEMLKHAKSRCPY